MLRNTVKELGSHSSLYLLGGIASVSASILLLPMYTRFLSRPDYGILEIIDSARYLLVHILLAGFMPAMTKFYKEANSPRARQETISTAFWCILCSSCFWGGGFFLYHRVAARELLGGIEFVVYIDLGISLLFIQVMVTMGENFLNMRKQSKLFLTLSLSRLVLNVLINLYCLIHLRLGAKGMLYGELFSSGFIGLFLMAYLIRYNGLYFRLHVLIRMLKFGLPFVPNMLSAVVMHRVDRYLLQKFATLADVGIYGLGYRFPFMLNSLLLDSFGRIWYSSVMYDVAKQEDSQNTYAKVTTYFVTVYVACQYVLIVMAPSIMRLLAAPKYFEAWTVVQVVGLGLCLYSVHTFFVIGAYIRGQTWYLPISYMLSALLNIVLNWHFLPKYGYMAAAWNTVMTYFVFSLLNFLIFRKKFPIPFEFGRLCGLFGIGGALVFLNNLLSIEHGMLEFAKELIFSMILPAFLLIGPYLDRNEKEAFGHELQKVHPKLTEIYARVAL